MKMSTAVFLFLAFAAPAAAQEGERLNLAGFLAEVRAANPEIAAAAAQAGAYAEKARQAAVPMDPVLEFERMYADGPLGSGARERTVALKQEFRNPLKYRLARSAAKSDSSYYSGLYGDRTSKVLAEAAEAFQAYLLETRNERLYAENLELLRSFARAAESRYAAGRGSQADALKAQVELSRAQRLLITAGQRKAAAAARVNALRNRPPGEPVPAPEELEFKPVPVNYAALEAAALGDNPYLKALKARLEASRGRLSLAKAGYAPDFMVGLRRRSADDAAMDGSWDVSVGLTLPLWFNRNRAEVREARADHGMAQAEYDSARNALLAELKAAAADIDCCTKLAELYEDTMMPQARQALKAALAGYEAGQASFMDLVEAGRSLLDTKREYYEYQADYAGRLARVKAITGENL